MATIEIPIAPSVADQRLQVQLEQETFGLRARWNERVSTWLLDVSDDVGVVVASVPIVVEAPLLRRYTDRRLPKGELVLVDTTGQGAEPGLADLGARCRLLYTESGTAEVPAR
jgi:hypothetical protein